MREITEIMCCRILMFMSLFGPYSGLDETYGKFSIAASYRWNKKSTAGRYGLKRASRRLGESPGS